jgi:predicted transcriptional regulator
MSELDTLKHDMKEIKQDQKLILKLLSPKNYTIGKVADITGKSRQAVRDWLTNNAEPEVDFFKKDGKIFISEKVALEYINARR